jgi:hypothetical protein
MSDAVYLLSGDVFTVQSDICRWPRRPCRLLLLLLVAAAMAAAAAVALDHFDECTIHALGRGFCWTGGHMHKYKRTDVGIHI